MGRIYTEANLKKAREYKEKNKEKIKAQRKAYYQANKDKELSMAKKWRKDNPELLKEIKKESDKIYYINNKDKIKEHTSKRKSEINKRNKELYHSDIQYNIKARLRASFTQYLRLSLTNKNTSIIKLIGIKIEDFINYIESKFKEGMSWDNKGEWHLDHIKPCASFDLTDPEQQKECFHYTNFQPLWEFENCQKSSHYEGKFHKRNNL